MEERLQAVLEDKGGTAVEDAKRIMVEGVESGDLRAALQYLAEHWQDPLRPALIALSCETVGGRPETTTPAATAMTLLCSCMNVYDNIMDRSRLRRFIPTLPEKFGSGLALIAAGLVTGKAFSVLQETSEKMAPAKCATVNRLFQEFLLKMSEAEAMNLRLRQEGEASAREKLQVLQMEAADIEACMKIGAAIGCGSQREIEQLGAYGSTLGTILRLREDLWCALNLTVELAQKIRDHNPPYVLTWAASHSQKARSLLSTLTRKERIEPNDIKEVVEVVFEEGAVEHIKELVEELASKSIQALPPLRKGECRSSLELVAGAQQYLLLKPLVL